MEKVSLRNLSQGAAIERFDVEFQKVLANIQDENTSHKVMRTVTLTVKVKPEEDRSFALVEIHTSSKLAPIAAWPTKMFFGTNADGEHIAQESNPRQLGIPFETKADLPKNVTELKGSVK